MANLKDHFNKKSLTFLARAIQKSYPDFAANDFLKTTVPFLKNKELKDRVRWISKCLHQFLPKDFSAATKILIESTYSEMNPFGVQGFLAWPFTQYIEDFGIDNFSAAMHALKEITKVMSAEFAIRPFLQKYEKEALSLLKTWATDENVHVRRLVSEGTRPRLPWGTRLTHFQKNPQICMPLLRKLRLDPEIYVRKSIANHLNDISKDHPDFLLKELAQWAKEYPHNANIRWIIKHSTRSLIKSGHIEALSLLGYKKVKVKSPQIKLASNKVFFGESLDFFFCAQSEHQESWLIDYIIHHQKANGELKPKVFKWTIKSTTKGEKISLQKKHAFRQISTRRYYQGKHLLEIQVNGLSVIKKEFVLILPKK